MLVDLASCLISLGSFALAPISYYATDGEYYNAASIRAIPLFFLGCLAVVTSAALRLRINVRSALVSAAIVYVVGNTLQNLLLGGTLDALYLAWTLGYIVTLYVAITLGVAIARRRQSTFDADEAARANR